MKEVRNDLMLDAVKNMELQICFDEDEVDLKQYKKIPFGELSVLGAAFSSLAPGINNIAQKIGSANDLKNIELFRKLTPGQLAEANDGSGMLGTIVKPGIGIVGQSRWEKVDPSKLMNKANNVPFDPAMMAVAAALMNIEKQLGEIKETQQKIIEFLIEDKEAGQKADIIVLTDLLNNYKYNFDNDDYLKSGYKHVLDIKRDAEKNIIFYQKQIKKEESKKSFVHLGFDVDNKINEIRSGFKGYQLALYLYSFSSFLEVILLRNFESDYLKGFVKKIKDYSNQYHKLYKECYKSIEEYSKSTVESGFLGGLSSVNKALGGAVSNIPFLGDKKIDKMLIDTSKNIDKLNSKNTKDVMKKYIENKNFATKQFSDNIKAINKIYNAPLTVLFDKENLYIKETVGAK